MDDSYRHLYLYSKGRYVRSNSLLDDIKQLVAVRCGLDKEHVSIKDAILVLTHAVEPHIKFGCFMNDLMNRQWLYREKDMNLNLISSMLSVLGQTKKDEISFNLGDPDPGILPLTNHDKSE